MKHDKGRIVTFAFAWLGVALFLASSIGVTAWGVYVTWWEECDVRASIALFVVGGLCLVLSSAEFGMLLSETRDEIRKGKKKEKQEDGNQ